MELKEGFDKDRLNEDIFFPSNVHITPVFIVFWPEKAILL